MEQVIRIIIRPIRIPKMPSWDTILNNIPMARWHRYRIAAYAAVDDS